ncbi:PIN domain-containing protein [Xanthobacter flavus]|uniref:PIN domain-containing protein n=1 Tax=Xanthobacter flavus TaxID=281 RepID=UPI00372A726F
MKHIADRFVVVLDANVLFPFRKRDVLLRFCEAGLFRARWSPQILDEWTRSLVALKPEFAASIQAQLAAMHAAFPEALVTGHEPLIEALELPDPGDRHVLAAAIRCGAQHIVTDNLSDFPAAAVDGFAIEAIDADEFLARTFDLYPTEALATLNLIREGYRKPPFTPSEFVMDLMAKGLPKLASRIAPLRSLM